MTDTRYYWYIPKHNKIVQHEGAFRATGLFESREQAIAYIEQADLSVSPDEVFLVEADTTEHEEATLHVGVDWNGPTQDSDPSELTEDEIGSRIDEWDDRHTKTLLETLEAVAEEHPNRLVAHVEPLVKRYEGADDHPQRRLEGVFKQISEVGADQVDPQISAVHDRFITDPTADTAHALVTLLPMDSTHTESVIETVISVLADETRGYEIRLAIAEQLSRLIQFPGTSIEAVTSALDEQDSLQAELLGIAGLDGAVTSYFDVETLVTYLESDDPVVRRAAVVALEHRMLRDSDQSLSAETIATLQARLVADWTTNEKEARNRTREIIAETATQCPESIGQITDELRADITATLEWVPENPGYGVNEITKYGPMAARALGRYYATTESVPTDLLQELVAAGRRRRAEYLAADLIRECPAVVDALVEYARTNPDAQREVYRVFGHVAGRDGDGPTRAWDALIEAIQSRDAKQRDDALRGIRMVTMPEEDLITDVDQFLDRIPSLRQHRKTLAGILETVAVEDQAVIAKLWAYVEAETAGRTRRDHTRRVIAAQALANVANRYPEHFDDIDRCIQQVQTDEDRVVTSFLSIIESVWGDHPAVLESQWSVLMNHFDPEASQARLQTQLNLMLPMAKEYPGQVDTETLHQLITHESVHIRTLVYDILGYAGPPTAHAQLTERAEVEDQEQAQHTIDHARTRLEVRFPDHPATE